MLEYIIKGGPIMLPLVGLSILALAVIIDRVRAFRTASADTDALRERAIELLEAGDLGGAIAECERFGGPVAAVLLVGIHKYRGLKERSRSVAEIESNVSKSMNDYAPHVIEALEKRLNLLTLIASTSPLLGMTGTVTGMIRSFGVMAEIGGLDASLVAGGIAEALITTAAGLLIAMPAVIAYNLFSRQVDRHVLEIEESATELIDFIALERAKE